MLRANCKKIYKSLPAAVFLIFGLLCIASPDIAAGGFLKGIKAAFYKVVPSVFPLMTVTVMIFDSPLAELPGYIFMPYMRLLKIKSRRAAAAVLLGLIGGFAPFCKAITLCVNESELTLRDAEILMCLCMGTGPAFIICGVGSLMLGSLAVGVKIYLSLCFSGFISSYIVSLFYKCDSKEKALYEKAEQNAPKNDEKTLVQSFVSAVSDSCRTCLIMCGFVAFFNTLCTVLSGKSGILKYISSFLLEVTCACVNFSAADFSARIYLCVAALSFCGLSIIFQSKAIMPPTLSLKTFFISRLLHIPLSLLIFRVFSFFSCETTSVYIAKVTPMRFKPDNGIILIITVIVFLSEITPTRLFTKSRR